jgi:hypothetical protein
MQPGLPLGSEALGNQYTEVMARLVSQSPQTLTGEWVFKASQAVSTMLSDGAEDNSVGLARVSVDGESVAIVSSRGSLEFNFAGTLTKGRLAGQIGLGGFSSKCEGAVSPDKISISFHSRTPDGTLRGNVVLQRLLNKPASNEEAHPGPANSRT